MTQKVTGISFDKSISGEYEEVAEGDVGGGLATILLLAEGWRGVWRSWGGGGGGFVGMQLCSSECGT